MQGSETSAATVPTTKVSDLVALVRAEYQELPGLCLTRAQVQRLWLLEPSAATPSCARWSTPATCG